ncbi:MAG: hypothetical protein MUQ51_07845 [Pseudomonadota bacterium]|nr:hypothetical protein [Pseudomonadota bacterium]MDO7711510.1 hypothetical protein [Pseudomonadota bacterium]
MADNETDEALEEIPSEEGRSNLASKILSKPMLIKITIGLITLLLISCGVYFFFTSSDKLSPEEAALDTNGEIIFPELIPPPSTSESAGTEGDSPNTKSPLLTKEYTAEDIKILKMREEAVALKEENLQMKERLSKLEATPNPNVQINNPESDTTTPEDNTKVSEAISGPKPKTNPYVNLYSRDDTLVREPQREPPPEPKWGNFDPLYRGK